MVWRKNGGVGEGWSGFIADRLLGQLARGLSALEQLWAAVESRRIWGRCAFPGLASPHLSPRLLALVQPSSVSASHHIAARQLSNVTTWGWGRLVSSCAPVGSCWRAVLALWSCWEECSSRVPVSRLCRTPAWWLNTTAWASSWGILLGHPLGAIFHLLLLLACRWGEDPWAFRSSARGIDLPCLSRGCGTHLYQSPVLRRVLPWPYRYLHT